MTTRVRFSRSADVFEAFPMLAHFAAPPPDDIDPLGDVNRRLATRRPLEAIALLAHTLPRREAVWWASRAVASLQGAGQDDCARAAEAWVRAPDEPNRLQALAQGLAAAQNGPTTWLALAAGRSGGNVALSDHPPAPAAPEACAQAVCAAVTLALVAREPRDILPWIAACVGGGIAFAQGAEAKILPPAAGRP